jgi:hypothetical protein
VKCVLTSLSTSLSRSLKPGSRIRGHHVSSNPRWAPVYFRLRHPARGASSGGTTYSLCLTLYAIMIHIIVLQSYVCFCISLSSCSRLLFLCPASCPSCATLSWMSLLEVPASYMGHLVIFCVGSRVAEWLSLEKANANGGPKFAACLAWFRTLSECILPS